MVEENKHVEVLQLRRLLFELKEHRPDICFRYRMLGQMWAPNFSRVISLTEKGLHLNDETSNRFVSIPDLSQIIQFELDKPFQAFKPYFHYDVVVSQPGA